MAIDLQERIKVLEAKIANLEAEDSAVQDKLDAAP